MSDNKTKSKGTKSAASTTAATTAAATAATTAATTTETKTKSAKTKSTEPKVDETKTEVKQTKTAPKPKASTKAKDESKTEETKTPKSKAKSKEETETKEKKAKKETKPKAEKKETKPKAEKSKKRENVEYPDAPTCKRPAYTFFFQEARPGIQAANPDAKFGELTAMVAEQWNKLPQAKKNTYEAMASKDAGRYEKEYAEWVEKVKALGGDPREIKREKIAARKAKRNKVKEPKKARNAYTFFGKEMREKLKGENLDFPSMTKRLAQEWKKVSDADKQKYEAQAAEDQARYEKDMEQFKIDHPETVTKKTRSSKPKDPTKPKKQRNAYIFYSLDHRDKVKAENADVTQAELMKKLGEKWSKLSPTEKEKYEELANKDKIRHEKEMEAWKASQPSA